MAAIHMRCPHSHFASNLSIHTCWVILCSPSQGLLGFRPPSAVPEPLSEVRDLSVVMASLWAMANSVRCSDILCHLEFAGLPWGSTKEKEQAHLCPRWGFPLFPLFLWKAVAHPFSQFHNCGPLLAFPTILPLPPNQQNLNPTSAWKPCSDS